MSKYYQPYTVVFSQSELVEEKEILKGQSENVEGVSGVAMGAASPQGNMLVINFDLEPECPDAELRATLQWIAASELGIPTIYFKKSQENRIEKVPCPVFGCE